jgi:hypothetical protein
VLPAQHLLEVREQFAINLRPDERQWEYAQAGSDKAIILPTNLPPQLFRGQTARHSPTLTTLARGSSTGLTPWIRDLKLAGQAKLVERIARRIWFCKELEAHPGAAWLADQKLKGFEFALAQHYGISTGYMDLSESFDVSCFFATCFEDKAGKWHPCTAGVGVMYLLPTEGIPIRPEVLQPIGLQVLPRPREQFGWVIVCGIGSDFEDIPGLQALEFSHSEAVSRYFLEMFSDGKALFPDDAMATVAARISKSETLPESTVLSVVRDLCQQEDGLTSRPSEILAEISSVRKLKLQGSIEVFDCELRAQAVREWSARAPQFLRNVGFRLVRSTPSDAS